MTSEVRRSKRSRSGLNVKFANDPDYDEQSFEDDQGDDDIMDELPVARVKQDHQRHSNQNNTNSSIIKRRRGRPAKHELSHEDDDDEDWCIEDEGDFPSVTSIDAALNSDINPSVYEFR